MQWDLTIVGGGLAGSLLAYRLSQVQPEWKVLLIHADEHLGGDHTWCFHRSDLTSDDLCWIMPLVTARWEGYSVRFPGLSRDFEDPYFMIR